jgi:hypothetical protein
LHEEWPGLVANQESIRDATWEIQAGLSILKRSAGADIDTLEVKASQTRDVLEERPEGFGSTTVWATSERMESDFSFLQSNFVRKGDQLTELRTHLTAMVSGMAEMADSAAQKAVKDRVMSGEVQAAVIISSYHMAAWFTIGGSLHPGDKLETRLERLENPTVQCSTTPPSSRHGDVSHERAIARCRS